MERLTSWDEDCVLINGHALGYATKCELAQMAERLAAYEDSGLSPQACAQAAEIEKQLASYDFSAKKMLEFIRADKDGRVVILPCRVGDTVWIVDAVRKLYSAKVRTFFCGHPSAVRGDDDDGHMYMIRTTECDIPMQDIGKTVFLTCAEAKKALQEMEGKKDGCTDTKKCN